VTPDEPTGGAPLLAGRYLLGPVLGSGGMAVVHRATDTLLDRPVAVKVVRGVDPDDAVRFRAETRVLARLHHPAVVTLYDAGTDGDRAFLVMQLVDGESLRQRLARLGPVTVAEAGHLATVLAGALASVHAAGVTHRDVKPGNVLLDAGGEPHLADFGIATALDSTRLTRTGMAVGTAPYLAPEQVAGEPVGPPADVYALGLLLLESLTGAPAYAGTGIEVALARLTRQPDVPATLPAGWQQLLTAMTARAAADRPSASSLPGLVPDAGATVLATAPTPALPIAAATGAGPAPTALLGPTRTTLLEPAPARRPPAARRWPWVAGAGAALAAVLGGILLAGGGTGGSTGGGGGGGGGPASPSPPAVASATATPVSPAALGSSSPTVLRPTPAPSASPSTKAATTPAAAPIPAPGKGKGKGKGGGGKGK